jgi:hypothetical protein
MTRREVSLRRRTSSFHFIWLALVALSCECFVAGDPSFFSCKGNVYDQANDRVRSFAIGYNLGKPAELDLGFLKIIFQESAAAPRSLAT